MAISVTIDGVTYPSRMAYFRTLEDQGNRSDASFYMHMRLKHDREFYEKEIIGCSMIYSHSEVLC